jgi:hypothetical protein
MAQKQLSPNVVEAIEKIDFIQGRLMGKLATRYPVFTDELRALSNALESIKSTLTK